MFRDVHAVLFDLDGTLIDSAPDLAAAADRMRVTRGLPSLPFDHYRPVCGAGARGLLGVAFGVKPGEAGFDELREEFFVNYESCMTQRTSAFPGIPELIDELLALGLAWGVVTNKSMRFAGPLTKSMALFASASTVVGGDTTPLPKPHPAPLLEAARQLALDPQRCLYVGDDERDVIAGKAAGMRTVAAAYGYLGGNADCLSWGAHAHVADPLELLNLLKQGELP
jgi:N-acetyl-D-muramate 6-phosphate phosphatase